MASPHYRPPIRDYHRTRLSEQNREKIIQLLRDEGLSVETVAKRFGVGGSTVRRVRAEYRERR